MSGAAWWTAWTVWTGWATTCGCATICGCATTWAVLTIGAETTWWLTTGTECTECTTGVATNLATGAEWWTTWLNGINKFV